MNSLSSQSKSVPIPCNECPAGLMHTRSIAYFTWLGDELITVPNFPAWVCDVCGNRIYDERSLALFAMLLNPEAGKPTRRVKTGRRSGSRKSSLPHPPLE